jgi:hypothetical protein
MVLLLVSYGEMLACGFANRFWDCRTIQKQNVRQQNSSCLLVAIISHIFSNLLTSKARDALEKRAIKTMLIKTMPSRRSTS